MSGWTETLPSGRYRAVYRDTQGDRHSKTFTTRREAKAFLAAQQTDLARGQWLDPRGGQLPFGQWATKWRAGRVLRPSSAAADESRLRIHLMPVFGDTALKDITPLGVRSFVAELATRRAPKTVRNVSALLSTILRDAVLEGLLLSNPCVGVRMPVDTATEARFLSPAELEALLAAAPPEHRTLLLTAAGTGLRWGELAALEVASLDLLRRRLQVSRTLSDVNGALSFGPPKTASSYRSVSLPPTLVTALDRHLREHRGPLLVTGPDGGPLRRSNFYSRVWRPTILDARLAPAPRFHDLRHTHVALLIAAGVPMKAIQRRLGHASIVMTMDRYGHLLADVDDKLVDGLEQQLHAL